MEIIHVGNKVSVNSSDEMIQTILAYLSKRDWNLGQFIQQLPCDRCYLSSACQGPNAKCNVWEIPLNEGQRKIGLFQKNKNVMRSFLGITESINSLSCFISNITKCHNIRECASNLCGKLTNLGIKMSHVPLLKAMESQIYDSI